MGEEIIENPPKSQNKQSYCLFPSLSASQRWRGKCCVWLREQAPLPLSLQPSPRLAQQPAKPTLLIFPTASKLLRLNS